MARHYKLSLVVLCGSSLVVAALCGGAAQAQTTTLSDQLIIYDATGKIVKNMKVLENSTTRPETTGFHGVGPAIKINAGEFGDFTVLEDEGPLAVTVSDIVGIHMTKTSTGPVYKFGFASDTETAFPKVNANWTLPGRQGIYMPEPTAPIDVTKYLDTSAASGQAGWHATFQSDVEPNGGAGVSVPVPEPGVWAMLLAGVGAMGGALRRRRSLATI
jgi:hypothetical protein